ncbi:MAG: DUF1566 domain-containing protein [Crocinitomicaceae bacterium]|nr:DUF1566 domain-containing protein [Crocinitomicaceae bacterium]
MKKLITLSFIIVSFISNAQRSMFSAQNNYVGPVLPAVPVLGATYGGGKIFYIFQLGDPGYVAGETHGLIAATANQTSSSWGCYGGVMSVSQLLGTGSATTTNIIANCSETAIAAKRARAVTDGGFTDWYLPSRDELNKLYINRNLVGGFVNGTYWSSSQGNPAYAYAYYQDFVTGDNTTWQDKNIPMNVRAIRTF